MAFPPELRWPIGWAVSRGSQQQFHRSRRSAVVLPPPRPWLCRQKQDYQLPFSEILPDAEAIVFDHQSTLAAGRFSLQSPFSAPRLLLLLSELCRQGCVNNNVAVCLSKTRSRSRLLHLLRWFCFSCAGSTCAEVLPRCSDDVAPDCSPSDIVFGLSLLSVFAPSGGACRLAHSQRRVEPVR